MKKHQVHLWREVAWTGDGTRVTMQCDRCGIQREYILAWAP